MGPWAARRGVLEQRFLYSEWAEEHRRRGRSLPHLTEWLPPQDKIPSGHALSLWRDQSQGRLGAGPASIIKRQGVGAGEVLPRVIKGAGPRWTG